MSLASEWASGSKQKRQTDLLSLIHGPWPPTIDYIDLVRTHGHWGVCASMGSNFNNALFGRDSLVVGNDLLHTHQSLVHDILVTLAKLQGRNFDQQTEEEPGKIHHEYRAQHLIDETTPIPLSSLQRLVDLEHNWGIQGHDYFLYYGSYDSTLLFVRLLGKYVEVYGDALLNELFRARDNNTYTMRDSVRAALSWISSKIELSSSGLMEYKRLNPEAIVNQSWKDSPTAYLHSNGSVANGESGIASVELQGYTYDSLIAGSKHFAEHEQQSQYWRKLASQIQQHTMADLWMNNVKFFAQGIDHDQVGTIRQIDTLTSNAGALLDSQLLFDLPDEQKQPMIEGVVSGIYSTEFVTDAGVRSRALRHKNIPAFIDYHGTYTVWPKETLTVARGLRAYGYPKLAEQFENRLLQSVVMAGEFYEFFYVESDGVAWYDRDAAMEHFSSKSPSESLPVPEQGQAWTISAVLHILYNRRQLAAADQNEVANQLEQKLLAGLSVIGLPTGIGEGLAA